MLTKAHVINLDRRKDRWDVVSKHLTEQRIDFVRFPAIDNKWMGCRDSHLAIMEQCKNDDQFLILEDDVEFLHTNNLLLLSLFQLPSDWDALYFGASPKEPQKWYSDNLFKLKTAHVTHAILWHNRKGGAVEYILSHREEIKKIDDYIATVIQPKFNCFVTFPMLATQRQTKSDTCQNVNVSTILTNYNKFCNVGD